MWFHNLMKSCSIVINLPFKSGNTGLVQRDFSCATVVLACKVFEFSPQWGNHVSLAELMLLGVISLLLSQTARWISEICVPSTLFTSKFYMCTEKDFADLDQHGDGTTNDTHIARILVGGQSMHVCDEVNVRIDWPRQTFCFIWDKSSCCRFLCLQGHEPFVSYEGLEQLHRFLFILGFTHVLYSFVTVVLSMIKVRLPYLLLIWVSDLATRSLSV